MGFIYATLATFGPMLWAAYMAVSTWSHRSNDGFLVRGLFSLASGVLSYVIATLMIWATTKLVVTLFSKSK